MMDDGGWVAASSAPPRGPSVSSGSFGGSNYFSNPQGRSSTISGPSAPPQLPPFPSANSSRSKASVGLNGATKHRSKTTTAVSGLLPSYAPYVSGSTPRAPAFSKFSVQITSVQEIRCAKPYVEYTVVVQSDSFSWEVKKRYSQFRDLHVQLTKCCPGMTLPKLPYRTLFNTMTPVFIQQRKRELEHYIWELFSHEELCKRKELRSFFEDYRHSVETRANLRLCEADRIALAARLEDVGAQLAEAVEGCDRMRQESAMVSKVAAHNDELKQRNAQLVVENAGVKNFIKERDELQMQAQRVKIQLDESERLRSEAVEELAKSTAEAERFRSENTSYSEQVQALTEQVKEQNDRLQAAELRLNKQAAIERAIKEYQNVDMTGLQPKSGHDISVIPSD